MPAPSQNKNSYIVAYDYIPWKIKQVWQTVDEQNKLAVSTA